MDDCDFGNVRTLPLITIAGDGSGSCFNNPTMSPPARQLVGVISFPNYNKTFDDIVFTENSQLNYSLPIVVLAWFWACAFPSQLPAQSPSNVESNAPAEVLIEGLVTECKKYSFRVKQGETEFDVKLANGAPVALKMNKPWYDWKNEQVVVDAVAFPNDAELSSTKRVAVKLPSPNLFLVSRFSDANQMSQIMAANVKRLNFYLITPEDQGQHLPTKDQPYISGSLSIQKNQQVRLQVDDQFIPVRLGFRYATMSGFSIMELEPDKTQVFIAGVPGTNENEIVASRVLFQPVRVSDPPGDKVSKN